MSQVVANRRELELEELEGLYKLDDNGRRYLDYEDIVEFAKNPNTVLHNNPLWTWDAGEAARKRNLDEARAIVRSYTIVRPDIAEPVRMIFNVQYKDQDTNRAYPTEVLLADRAGQEALLGRALGELAAFQRKYAILKELVGAIDEVKLSFGKTQDQ